MTRSHSHGARERWLRRSLLVGVFSLGAVAACMPAAGTAQQPGRLVIVGGALSPQNEAVHRAVLEGRQGDGPLCIIPTAGPNPPAEMPRNVARFTAYGGEDAVVGVLLSVDAPQDAFDPQVVARLRECGGYYFTGGSQSLITRFFRPDGQVTPALEAIHARHRQGAVVGGTSAGAAIMSDPMITGGNSADAAKDGVAGRGVRIGHGLGFLRGALVDQHFLSRGRIGRLLVAVLQLDEYDLGLGIDENTALVVDGDEARVVGASGVILVDAQRARMDSGSGAATGVELYLLGDGDRFNLSNRRLSIDPNKKPLRVGAEQVQAPEDAFDRWQFLRLLHALGQSPDREVHAPAGDHILVISKDPAFTAVAREGSGVEGTPAGLTVGPLHVDIRPRRDQ